MSKDVATTINIGGCDAPQGERTEMCGICGFVSRKEISRETLKIMNDTMVHRGPDDSGEEVFVSQGFYVGLAQRRLSILDLSELGHQPMHTFDKSVSVVFNGEIYNFRELRKQLDYPFISDCDTEVILAAYLKWGIDCLKRFNGMFAIAIYDHRDDTLYLARDRIGKKPLYYWLENGNLVFASELKPIMACPGFPKEIRREILPRFLFQICINAPDTIFEHTWKLEPGKFLQWKAGQIRQHTYWDLLEVYHRQKQHLVTDYEEAKAMLKDKLTQAVRYRMIADVPLGTFLSGGYDSSLITALAQSISDKPVKTFCIGFHEEKWNEAPYAAAVAKHLGTNHTELYIEEQEMLDLVDSIPKFYDEPFADSSQIPTMLVSRLAKQDVTVVLTGDAGDEFFCGYNFYDLMPWAELLDLPGALTYAVGQFPSGGGKKLIDRLPYAVQLIAKNRDTQTKTQLRGFKHDIEIIRNIAGHGISEKYPIEETFHENHWQQRRMLLDMLHCLPGDILCKVDRASMKYSLESRCPFLDVDVMEYSFSLAHKFKYHKKEKKRILHDLSHSLIPRELLERRKTGFSVPLDKWLRTVLRERLLAYSRADVLRRQGLFYPEFTETFVNDYLVHGDGRLQNGKIYSKLIWSFFMFQMWYVEYIDAL